jgi:SSS family solute:Na+ symporter
MQIGSWDIAVFLAYFVGVVTLGILVAARSRNKSADSFFRASKKLPWYVVGASLIAANISTEHFIGMIGWAFLYGAAVSHWCWLNAATFTVLIWVFLPFYMRGNVTTMPEFLERRYNRACRYIYAIVSVIGLVIALLGGVMFAGAKAISVFFPEIPMPVAIVLLAAAAGAYTIYGGLLSAAWADFMQYCLLMLGGLTVLLFGIYHSGGLTTLVAELPEKFIMFHPPTHQDIPWTGTMAATFSVGVWYSSANQFMVQRCVGACSE